MRWFIVFANWIGKRTIQTKTFRKHANYNYANFCEDLKNVNLRPKGEESSADVNELWDTFEQGFVSIADKHAPVIQKRLCGVW